MRDPSEHRASPVGGADVSAADSFAARGFAGQPIDHCLVVDAHAHLGPIPGFPCVDPSLDALVEHLDALGVDVFCPSAVPGIMGYARRGNDIVIDATRRYPKRIFGYMMADIGYPDRITPELERCLEAGLRAVKIWSYGSIPGHPYDHPNYVKIYEFARQHGLPVLAHTFSVDELAQLEKRIVDYPTVDFMLAHAGAADRERYVELASEHANVYLETCMSASPRGLVEYFVGQGLAPKVLWGSDAPFMGEEQQLGRVLFAQISEADKRMILGQNAARVLGLNV